MKGNILELKDEEQIIDVFKALGSEPRMKIIEVLQNEDMNLNQISQYIDMPASSVTVNIKKLEEAGLIETEYKPGNHGSQKICSLNYDKILINLPGSRDLKDKNLIETSMPIGNYKDFEVTPTCGLASEKGVIGELDDVKSFLNPNHTHAQILWFGSGYIKYVFPNDLPKGSQASKLELSMEICSETSDYDEDWPSDISIWINGVEIGVWTSPGDFGEKRGILNPDWWYFDQTQHGLLKIWKVTEEGTYIDGNKISDVNLADINIEENDFIEVKIGVKKDARNVGGVNLFGRKFGNYKQDIMLRYRYNFNKK
ncbi:ArsR/SmtB family transcription factor [Halanaerobium hydrogeniformans]|uniref:Regulatory protein ArsR n=1 Tax=Halanaerobium hydrogeniformans TaxID=656519 RepID=E4RNE2_HALHG|nr:ArsR family transcriptional regulator [Halanaerobium hydrogeniformans]ADQ13610.1 regulatory protein ArsR [Halanaerobium hydrogeniformans]